MRLTIRLMTACCVSAINLLAASAQDTATTQALNLDNNIVNQSLQRFSQGINIGKIAVDSTAVTSDSVKIFLNSALQNVPMRSDNVADITKALAEQPARRPEGQEAHGLRQWLRHPSPHTLLLPSAPRRCDIHSRLP